MKKRLTVRSISASSFLGKLARRRRGDRFIKEALGSLFNLGKGVFDTGFDLATGIADDLAGKYHPLIIQT